LSGPDGVIIDIAAGAAITAGEGSRWRRENAVEHAYP
jgi:hypothetical protein